MSVQLPFFILSLLLHAGILITSSHAEKNKRFVIALIILGNTWSLFYGAALLQGEGLAFELLARLLRLAPYYMPLFSFLAYWRVQ